MFSIVARSLLPCCLVAVLLAVEVVVVEVLVSAVAALPCCLVAVLLSAAAGCPVLLAAVVVAAAFAALLIDWGVAPSMLIDSISR